MQLTVLGGRGAPLYNGRGNTGRGLEKSDFIRWIFPGEHTFLLYLGEMCNRLLTSAAQKTAEKETGVEYLDERKDYYREQCLLIFKTSLFNVKLKLKVDTVCALKISHVPLICLDANKAKKKKRRKSQEAACSIAIQFKSVNHASRVSLR